MKDKKTKKFQKSYGIIQDEKDGGGLSLASSNEAPKDKPLPKECELPCKESAPAASS